MKRKLKSAAVQEEEEDHAATELLPKKKSKKEKKVLSADLVEDEEGESKKNRKSKKKKAAKHDSELGIESRDEQQVAQKGTENGDENLAQSGIVEDAATQKKPQRNKESGEVDNNLRLFIRNIPTSIDEATLRSDFEVCGKVTNMKLLRDSSGQSRGLAFVTYEDEAGCSAALEYNNEDYGGKKLAISRAEAKHADNSPAASTSNGEKREGNRRVGKVDLRVIVKNMPLTVDEDTFRRDFEECGKIINSKLLVDHQGQSRGMGFVTYEDETGYFAALKYNGSDYGGKRLVVKRAESSGKGVASLGPKPPGCNSLVLTKLSPEVTTEDIYDFFKDCGGGATKVGLLTDSRGQSRCTARVDFQGDALDKAAALVGSASLKGQAFCMEFCIPKTW